MNELTEATVFEQAVKRQCQHSDSNPRIVHFFSDDALLEAAPFAADLRRKETPLFGELYVDLK